MIEITIAPCLSRIVINVNGIGVVIVDDMQTAANIEQALMKMYQKGIRDCGHYVHDYVNEFFKENDCRD